MNYSRRLEVIEELESKNNILFKDLLKIATEFFGEPRVRGSHHIFKTPWEGKPWVNLQRDGKQAKPYQVKQVIAAILKLS